jgi:hypothetical protein
MDTSSDDLTGTLPLGRTPIPQVAAARHSTHPTDGDSAAKGRPKPGEVNQHPR